jgi:hypothetical protein
MESKAGCDEDPIVSEPVPATLVDSNTFEHPIEY